MNALKPRPYFRSSSCPKNLGLGRERSKPAYALKQITDAGVRVFFYLEDRERTLDSPRQDHAVARQFRLRSGTRERAKQRTYDAMVRKAKAGHVTGGKVLAMATRSTSRRWAPAACSPSRESDRVGHRPADLRDVRWRSGDCEHRQASQCRTACPAPRQSPRGWAPSAVREILHRPLYKGEIVWNQHQKIVRGGTKKRRQRDEKDWIRLDAPDLQDYRP